MMTVEEEDRQHGSDVVCYEVDLPQLALKLELEVLAFLVHPPCLIYTIASSTNFTKFFACHGVGEWRGKPSRELRKPCHAIVSV